MLRTTFAPLLRLGAALAAGLLLAGPAGAQVKEYLGVPGPLRFEGQSYRLAWSSKPSANYVKQEYVPAGQDVQRYRQMLLVEQVLGGISVTQAVRAQVDTLNKRKAADPMANMDLVQNPSTGEALLDFLVSSRDRSGQVIVEWNAYRYAPIRRPSGEKGVLLFAVSQRAYGNDDAKAFLARLKQVRPARINALARAPLPKAGP
jgi:hypothetical protein